MPDSQLTLNIPVTQTGTEIRIPFYDDTRDPQVGGIIVPISNITAPDYSNIQLNYSVDNGTDPQYVMSYTLFDHFITWGNFVVPANDSVDQALISSYRANLLTIIQTLMARPAFSGYMPWGFYLSNVTSSSHNLYGQPAFFVLDPSMLVSNQISFAFPGYLSPTIDLTQTYLWYIGYRCWPSVYFVKAIMSAWVIGPC